MPEVTLDRFRERYQDAQLEDLPWYHADPDEDLLDLLERECPQPAVRALDLGAGPAVHSLHLASLGIATIAVDAIPRARELALQLALQRGLELDYRLGDALEIRLEQPADIVFDRGFLHTLDAQDHARWRQAVVENLRPGGLLLVKAFDVYPARNFGPTGMPAGELIAVLGPPEPGGLLLRRLLRTQFPGSPGDHGAWSVAARRLG